MATQAIETVPEAGDAAPPSPKGKRGVLILAAVGITAGLAAGLFGLGPILAKSRSAAKPAPKTEAAAGAAVSKSIENLVLNPAGSGGTRFLMVTATFELKDGATLQAMKDHEPEVRDRILSLLGKRTVEELSDISQRDAIKQAVLEVVQPLFPKGSVLKVFFSQFVIQ